MMDLTEGMMVACVRALGEQMQLPYGETTVDFTPPWPRVAYSDLFARHVGVSMSDADAVLKIASDNGLTTTGKHPDVLVHELFEQRVEPVLAREATPVFVHD